MEQTENTFITMVDELREECEEYKKLTYQLEIENLTEEQFSGILRELFSSVVELTRKSKLLQDTMEGLAED